MKPERQNLLRDLLHGDMDDRRREGVLLAGGKILRRKRWFRFATRSLAVLAVVALAIVTRQQWNTAHSVPVVSTASHSRSHVTRITDDELLALFPGTPVALATINGQKRLIFPRPSDEARFVSRPLRNTTLGSSGQLCRLSL